MHTSRTLVDAACLGRARCIGHGRLGCDVATRCCRHDRARSRTGAFRSVGRNGTLHRGSRPRRWRRLRRSPSSVSACALRRFASTLAPSTARMPSASSAAHRKSPLASASLRPPPQRAGKHASGAPGRGPHVVLASEPQRLDRLHSGRAACRHVRRHQSDREHRGGGEHERPHAVRGQVGNDTACRAAAQEGKRHSDHQAGANQAEGAPEHHARDIGLASRRARCESRSRWCGASRCRPAGRRGRARRARRRGRRRSWRVSRSPVPARWMRRPDRPSSSLWRPARSSVPRGRSVALRPPPRLDAPSSSGRTDSRTCAAPGTRSGRSCVAGPHADPDTSHRRPRR